MLSSAFPRIATRASRAQFGKVRINNDERARNMDHATSNGKSNDTSKSVGPHWLRSNSDVLSRESPCNIAAAD